MRFPLILALFALSPALVAQEPAFATRARQLAEFAFDVASAVPAEPHRKTRDLLQENVVAVLLELDHVAAAQGFVDRCADGWRKGVCKADLADRLVDRGAVDAARAQLQQAALLADTILQDANPQEWRRDRVRARIARVYTRLGDTEQAGVFAAGLEPREAADLAVANVDRITAANFEACLQGVDSTFPIGDFDQVRAALTVCARLFERFYDDAERRAQLATRVRTGFEKLPIPVRLDLVSSLAATALRRGDRVQALELVRDLQFLIERVKWLPEAEVAWRARVAALRGRAGEAEPATADLLATAAKFDRDGAKVESAFRADGLRELAAAWTDLGDADRAKAAWRLAIDVGAENPNARPRAEDLVGVGVAMLRSRYEPDDALLARLREVRAGLRAPW